MSRSKRAARAAKKAEIAQREDARRKRRRVTTLFGTIGGGGLLIGIVFLLASSAPSLSGDTGATSWDLPGLADTEERITLADFTGKPTIAVFFASWCTVCEREIPGFAALSDRLGDQVNWVGINSQDAGNGMRDARKWGIDTRWPLAQDVGGSSGNGLSTATFGVRGMPLTVVYDEVGAVVHVQRGGIDATGLFRILENAFGVSA